MYAVGRLGSYISRGVYSVSAPFHPFGGAVDIIVVEQPDGSFKSSPWYVRFGEDGDEDEYGSFSFPFPSGYESDEPSCPNRRPLKSLSFNYDGGMSNSAEQIDVSKGKVVSRTSSQPSLLLYSVLGQSSEDEDDYREDGGSVMRLDSLECAEIAAGVLEMKWPTNIVYDSSNDNASSGTSSFEQSKFQSSVNDKGETDLCRTSSSCEGFMEGKSETIATIAGAIDGNSVGNSHLQCQHKLEPCKDKQFDGEVSDNEKTVGLPVSEIFSKEAYSDSLQSFVSESSECEVHVDAETLVRTTDLVPEVDVNNAFFNGDLREKCSWCSLPGLNSLLLMARDLLDWAYTWKLLRMSIGQAMPMIVVRYPDFVSFLEIISCLRVPSLNDMGISSSCTHIIWSDNTSAIAMSANPILHSRSKHVKLELHFMGEGCL
ncbi:hypothetical protein F3Y22_tig00112649pilonHSYRG00026 [Hibiscus syriacus]|uniref:Lipin N-terminal domain-containing protein n=1 Tax=Hibiscus syriacus TaxID=106335 RepID=A0A6A2WVF5_HIBSY|nr:hypothetical protein F3Y22_tig00112649pilonHSYRG00026 [Hibiscus syriacus]